MNNSAWMRRLPWSILAIALALVCLGWLGIARADEHFDHGGRFLRQQVVWSVLAVTVMMVLTVPNYRVWQRLSYLALGVAMAYTGLKRHWQQVTLVLLGIPTAIFVNILRVVTLAMLSLYDTDFAAGDFHTFIGLLWLVPAFLMYLGLQWILCHLVVEEAPA